MKNVLLLFLGFIITYNVHAQKVYKSEKYNYTITIPNSFNKSVPEGKNIDFRFEDNFNLVIVHVSERQPNEYLFSPHDYPINIIAQDKNLIDHKKIYVSDEKCLVLTSKEILKGLKTICVEATVFHGANVFFVTCYCLESDYNVYKSTFLDVIKSINFGN